MSRIFLSHSSNDNFEAFAIREWLSAEGWDDVFLDFDPDKGIVAGERWERALHAAATRCEAVVFLVSDAWLASGWCLKEYTLARGLNKKLFAVLIDRGRAIPDLPRELVGTWQVVDLARGQEMRLFRARPPGEEEEKFVSFSEEGLRRLRRGLEKAGLEADFFAWPPPQEPSRAPYRGLKPLTSADAGIFFGRDAPIVEAMQRLRGLAEAAAPRILVVLGASGAGKSSFLRAGLLPRLARDDAHFLPLPPIRPERAALHGESGLLGALSEAFPMRTRPELRAAIAGGAAALRPLLAELVAGAAARLVDGDDAQRAPTVVIAIDQAEELLRGDGAEEGARLLALLRALAVQDDPAVIVVLAIRSDTYDALEHAKALEGLPQSTLPLLPLPRIAYKEVIEGPVRRFGEAGGKLAVEPQFTQALLDDIEQGGGSDALPLLAFTLEQLFLERHTDGLFRSSDYDALGGLKGAIEAAVQRAFARADDDPRIPRDRAAREALLRRGLIPWLAGIDPESRVPRRNIARRADVPAEALPLIDLLVEERLLSTDTMLVADPIGDSETRIVTIEPSHEALLRQWGLLEGWLAQDFALLAALEGVQRATRDWDANARGDAWLAHQGERLAEAQSLDARADIAAKLDALDRAYLERCRSREDALRAQAEQRRQEREAEQARRLADAQALATANRRTARRTAVGLVAALVLAAIAAGFGIYAQRQRSAAERSLATATDTANTLVFDLARRFRDVTGMPASMVKSLFERALKLQSDLIGAGQTSTDLVFSQASALSAVSQTLIAVGDVEGSRRAAEKSVAIWRKLLAAEPKSVSIRRGLAAALNGLGDARMLADKPDALAAFAESLALDRAIAEDAPGPISQEAVATGLQRVGDARSRGGDRAGGLKDYEASTAIYRKLAADPKVGPAKQAEAKSDIAHGLDRIGAIKSMLGDRAGALAAFEEGLQLRREVVARDKDDAIARRDLAWTLDAVGEFKEKAGDRDGALAAYEESLELRRELARDKSNARAQRDFSESLMRVADIKRHSDDVPGALAAIEEGIVVSRGFARDKSNVEAQRNLAESLQSKGDVEVEAGDLPAALAAYKEALAIFRELAKSRTDPSTRRDLALILDSLGDAQLAAGNRAAALAAYQEGLPIRRERAADLRDIEAQRDLAIGLEKIGDVGLAEGDTDAALRSFEAGLEVFRRLSADKNDLQAQRDVTLALVKIGDARIAARDPAGALAAYEECLGIRRVLARDKRFSTATRDLAAILDKIGELKLSGGDAEGALAALDECLTLLRDLDTGKTDTRSRREFMAVSQQVAMLKLKAGDRPGALAAFKTGLPPLRALAALNVDDLALQAKLVITLNNIGGIEMDAGDVVQALAAFQESVGGARLLAADDDGKRNLTLILDNIGIAQRKMRKFTEARAAFLESLQLRRDLARAANDAPARLAIAVSLDHIGDVEMDEKKFLEALDAFRESLGARGELLVHSPADAGLRGDLRSDAEQVGAIAYHTLLTRAFAKSLEAVDLAIRYAPDLIWLYTNKAHALMFLGRTREARALYLAHRGERASKDQTWEEAVLGDFAAFRKAGLSDPLMDEIETAMKAPQR